MNANIFSQSNKMTSNPQPIEPSPLAPMNTQALICNVLGVIVGQTCRYEQLLQYRTEACPLVGKPLPKGGSEAEGGSKADMIQQLLNGSFPDFGGHDLEIKKNYVACKRCGQMILRHSSMDKLAIFCSENLLEC